jgi:hypothetical protein
MPCTITCLFATIIIISNIYFLNATSKSKTIQHYQEQLPSNLRKIYNEIREERLRIYYYGYFLGLVISLVVIFYNYQKSMNNKSKQQFSLITITCMVITISFTVNYFYYLLTPKTKWMLDYVNTPEQTKAWLNMYKHMQKYYHTGFVVGIIGVALISLAFRKSP